MIYTEIENMDEHLIKLIDKTTFWRFIFSLNQYVP